LTVISATKHVVVNELQNGTKNVLFVIAHSDSKAIFLPGVKGGKLSFSELSSITRLKAPSRTIVLLACKTGAVNEGTRSIAELLLKNKLATAVLASAHDVYATDLPEMFGKLRGSTLRDSFPQFRAIVELQTTSNPVQP
jgi:hypothetical protein